MVARYGEIKRTTSCEPKFQVARVYRNPKIVSQKLPVRSVESLDVGVLFWFAAHDEVQPIPLSRVHATLDK